MRNVVRPFLFAALLAVSAVPALADQQKAATRAGDVILLADDQDGRWRGRGRGPFGGAAPNAGFKPLEVVLANVASQFPGRHLGVDGPFQRDGRWMYRIKWLTPDGRVLIIFADAQTGQVIGFRG